MFNSRDEKTDYFYDPYAVGCNVENRMTGEIAKIVCINGDVATLQMHIDEDLDSKKYLEIEVRVLKSEWKEAERIIIGKLSKKEDSVHIPFEFNDDFFRDYVGFEVIGKSVIVPKSKVKRRNT